MKNIFSIIKFTAALVVVFAILYPLLILGIAQFSPNQGKGETVSVNGKVVGYQKIGQKFDEEIYFWGRPSAVDYNAAGSGGSNKAASNKDYLQVVETRITAFVKKNPTLTRNQIPSEMVTASGSGLDPDISIDGAKIQIARIAKARNMNPQKIDSLLFEHTNKRLITALGPKKVNVLALNTELDKISN
jgi:K+-transporting ATPase ATPase C chain